MWVKSPKRHSSGVVQLRAECLFLRFFPLIEKAFKVQAQTQLKQLVKFIQRVRNAHMLGPCSGRVNQEVKE